MLSVGFLIFFPMFSYVDSYGNLALDKYAWQEFPYSNLSGDAGKAVDGKRGSLSEKQSDVGDLCVKSADRKKTATWRVDLGQIFPIHHVIIYYRISNRDGFPFGSQINGFFLYISNTSDYYKENGKLCTHDFRYKIFSSMTYINCPVSGRYVIYYNERRVDVVYDSRYSTFAYNNLCEVEVYGCLHPDARGINCSVPCPDYCDNCNKNGTCISCKNDLSGHFCNNTESNTLPQSDKNRNDFLFTILIPVALVSSVVVVLLSSIVIFQRRSILKRRKEDENRETYNHVVSQSDRATYDTIQFRDSHEYEEAEARYDSVI